MGTLYSYGDNQIQGYRLEPQKVSVGKTSITIGRVLFHLNQSVIHGIILKSSCT